MFGDHREMLVTQAFLCAGGVSVNRWQSLSLSHKPRAAMQSAAPAAQAPPSSASLGGAGLAGWKTGVGAPQALAAGTKKCRFVSLGQNVLPEALIVLPILPIHRHALVQKSTKNIFSQGRASLCRGKPFQALSPPAAGMWGAFLKLLGNPLGWSVVLPLL